jgi:lipopolysaccharide/colanic/teichoic acid biosynthesis glycosyltransferase
MNSYLPSFVDSLLRDTLFRKVSIVGSHREFAQIRLLPRTPVTPRSMLLPEQWFSQMLSLERKRTERSRIPFLLMSMNIEGVGAHNGHRGEMADRIVNAIMPLTRETDIFGWQKSDAVLGTIFTSVGDIKDPKCIVEPIRSKILQALSQQIGSETTDALLISFQLFPEKSASGPCNESKLYEDLPRSQTSGWLESRGKRALDILGSLTALTILLPLFLLLAIAIKLTSRGPVLFRQERIGRRGTPFTFLKFRSMHVGTDSRIHQEYVSKFINGDSTIAEGGVFKITADPRITPIGKFLRKTSLDELPQFWNVLRGDMSLVGPRPAVRYEVEAYDLWHRLRVLDAKPGITGLWQINGRSRTKFDDMVRLDLRYTRTSSLALDLKILWRTPMVVVMGDGAY